MANSKTRNAVERVVGAPLGFQLEKIIGRAKRSFSRVRQAASHLDTYVAGSKTRMKTALRQYRQRVYDKTLSPLASRVNQAKDVARSASAIADQAKTKVQNIYKYMLEPAVKRADTAAMQYAGDIALKAERTLASAQEGVARAQRLHSDLVDVYRAARNSAAKHVRAMRASAAPRAEKLGGMLKSSLAGRIAEKAAKASPLTPEASRTVLKAMFGGGRKGWSVGKVVEKVIPTNWPSHVGKLYASGYDRVASGVAKHLAKNAAGRTVGLVGKAAFGPGALAASAWIDAGLQAYDLFTSDAFKNGKVLESIGRDKAGFAKDYGREVLKGFGRLFTLGFLGNGDATEDSLESNVSYTGSDGKEHTITAAEALTRETVAEADKEMLRRGVDASAVLEASAANAAAARARANPFAGKVTDQGIRDHVAKLVAERDRRLAGFAANRDNWRSFQKSIPGGRWTAQEYYDQASARENARFDRAMAAVMRSEGAADLVERNRKAFYSWLTEGRDYDADYAAEGAKRGSVEGFGDFLKMWNDASDQDRLTWTKEAADKEYYANGAATQGAIGAGKSEPPRDEFDWVPPEEPKPVPLPPEWRRTPAPELEPKPVPPPPEPPRDEFDWVPPEEPKPVPPPEWLRLEKPPSPSPKQPRPAEGEWNQSKWDRIQKYLGDQRNREKGTPDRRKDPLEEWRAIPDRRRGIPDRRKDPFEEWRSGRPPNVQLL